MRDIKVEYDGEYPNTCSGNLKIYLDNKLIYDKEFCCNSTGSVWLDDEWQEHVEEGELVWDGMEAKKFDKDIVDAVNKKLSEFHVCCGGCV